MNSRNSFEGELHVWECAQAAKPGHMGFRAAALKDGPRTFKTVSNAKYGDSATGEIRRNELRLSKFCKLPDGSIDFDHPEDSFAVENEEIGLLSAFLTSPDVRAGYYDLVPLGSEVSTLLRSLAGSRLSAGQLTPLLEAADDVDSLAEALRGIATGISVAEMVILAARRDHIARLRAFAESGDTTETVMQSEMKDAQWVFGGRYVGVLPRRDLALLDQVDIPLVCADGCVHVVELKGPVIPDLVVRHRNHLITGKPVHEAVSQTMNYLRSLDEQGPQVDRALKDIGINVGTRRAFGTVIIGHPDHIREDLTFEEVEETLRTYNSHLSRVEVITYGGLLDAAERSLSFTG